MDDKKFTIVLSYEELTSFVIAALLGTKILARHLPEDDPEDLIYQIKTLLNADRAAATISEQLRKQGWGVDIDPNSPKITPTSGPKGSS